MRKFEEFTNGNVTEVKSAINNGRAMIIMYCNCSRNTCIKPEIVEKTDIYSLYDHKSLIIVRVEDSIRVCQLKKFCKIDNTYIVIVEYVGRDKILNQLIDAGIEEGSPIYEQAEAIFDKAVGFEKQIEEANKKEDDEEEFSDDVFDILNGKVKKNKDNDFTGINPFEMLAKILVGSSAMHPTFDEVMKDPKNAELYNRAKNFKKEKGRLPSYEEFINLDSSLTDEQKKELIKRHDDSPLAKINDILKKIADSMEDDMKKK